MTGCSEYLDRRDTIALGAGDAVATDEMTQMVDPWPRVAAERNIGFNGERMESAVQRYKTNRTYPPSNSGTSTSYAPTPAAANAGAGRPDRDAARGAHQVSEGEQVTPCASAATPIPAAPAWWC